MTLEEIEQKLLVAPTRYFKDFEVKGYFAPELRIKFGVTSEQLYTMLKKRKTFGHKLLAYKTGDKKYFFYLK